MTTVVYGIKNCDTIKKARRWLEQHQINYRFHDYRQDGIDADWLADKAKKLGWQALLNTRGTTYRNLSAEQKDQLNEQKAISLMLAAPAMIKRPLLEHDGQLHLGFKISEYEAIFQ